MKTAKIPRYYSSQEELGAFIKVIPTRTCPRCFRLGTLILHGFLKGYGQEGEKNERIRGRRIFCTNRGHRAGCGHTLSILSTEYVRGFVITTAHIWAFLLGLFQEDRSIRATVHAIDFGHTESAAYHLHGRLRAGISWVRAQLHRAGHATDPPCTFDDPLRALKVHLSSLFGSSNPIAAFQQDTQQSFLLPNRSEYHVGA